VRTMYTYGVLPPQDDFYDAFEEKVPGARFKIVNDKWVGTVDLNRRELWEAVQAAVKHFNEDGDLDSPASRFASDVLSILGFEWD